LEQLDPGVEAGGVQEMETNQPRLATGGDEMEAREIACQRERGLRASGREIAGKVRGMQSEQCHRWRRDASAEVWLSFFDLVVDHHLSVPNDLPRGAGDLLLHRDLMDPIEVNRVDLLLAFLDERIR
jgi:hypothetical protein